MNKNSIALIGMSGVGKTTVGKELAKALDGCGFVDIDDEIEKYANKTITEIFEEFGEPFFRVLEKDTIKKITESDIKQVISLGGGAFEDELTRKNLLENSTVIYLKAKAEDIYERIKYANNRPLLKDLSPEKIDSIMQKRIVNYEKAHFTIDTTNKTPYNIVEEIMNLCLK